jgi:hypothetical protein
LALTVYTRVKHARKRGEPHANDGDRGLGDGIVDEEGNRRFARAMRIVN